MCGIIGYIGKKTNAVPILIEGLHKLESRGYDSAGMYVHGQTIRRVKGSPKELTKNIPDNFTGSPGIAHNRWATQGEASENNAHPHTDCHERFVIVHNGVIENYHILKSELQASGHEITSDTDTELIAHCIEEEASHGSEFAKACVKALQRIEGTYGLVVLDTFNPNTMFVACLSSPVVIGIGDGEYYVCSQSDAIAHHTRTYIELNDYEYALITPNDCIVNTFDGKVTEKILQKYDGEIEHMGKDGHDHYMLKEIYEAPEVISNTIRGRLDIKTGDVKLGGIEAIEEKLNSVKRIIIVGCGSAYYAGLVGRKMIEELAGIPVEVEIASEYIHQKMIVDENTIMLAISQSGETADTLACIKEANKRGILTLGIVNKVGTKIARETVAGIYNHAGPEYGVASTKAFVSQLVVLVMFALYLGRRRGMSRDHARRVIQELQELPQKIKKILANKHEIELIARMYKEYEHMLYIGRQFQYPIACEGALKLKEVSYMHAEAYGAGEMKHGPIAMIDPNFPTFAIALKDRVYGKMKISIGEISSRHGRVCVLATEGDREIYSIAHEVIHIPKSSELVAPILSTVAMQLFAYAIGTARGVNVDQPRNLAKSVTVE